MMGFCLLGLLLGCCGGGELALSAALLLRGYRVVVMDEPGGSSLAFGQPVAASRVPA
jgi:hypothetical protein